MEANFLEGGVVAEVKPNGKAHIAVTQEPELRATGMPRLHLAQMVVQTSRGPELIDITDLVSDMLAKTGIKEGNVLVYSRHTTAGIVINENEPLLIQDMYRFLEKMASPADNYDHNDFSIRTVNMCEDECANGHAHCQHLTIGCSQQIPVVEGHLALGRWQRLFLLEMDRPRTREVLVQFFGV
ncbi:MAG: secondary thiamine-phosphate synthase enzyme YjbQ [Candidatus Eremiobacterota bacterium]